MKTTVVVSLEEDVIQFLEEQGQVDASAYINKLLRDEQQRRSGGTGDIKPASESNKVIQSAPSASSRERDDLEELSDLNTPAAD